MLEPYPAGILEGNSAIVPASSVLPTALIYTALADSGISGSRVLELSERQRGDKEVY
jgi:hypothetical protein